MHSQVIRRLMRFSLVIASPALALLLAGCPAPSTGGGGGSGGGGGDPPPPQPLSVEVVTVGQGTVAKDASADGTQITLRPEPDAGWIFDRWTGATLPDPQADPLILTADEDITSITATFIEDDDDPGQQVPDDADGDNVPDDEDDCLTTPPGEQVDETGCAASERDTDGDHVNDADDACPTTPSDIDVDERGCPISTDNTTDSDGDGVPDDIDRCEDTEPGVTIDANGCVDTDGDGVADMDDDCPETPAAAVVDAKGCAESQRDGDSDNVNDDVDACANTPEGEEVDEVGCADSQLDDDGDGVNNDVDQCLNTPAREQVDPTTGCAPSNGGGGGGPVCGNGAPEPGEECDDGNTTPGDGCDANCQIEPGCGNGIIETGETCDDNNTVSGDGCDANCQTEPGGPVCGNGTPETGEGCDDGNTDPGDGCDENCQTENDDCQHPLTVDAGTISFSNAGATTDGPDDPGACALEGTSQIDADVWFLLTSPCTDDVIVSVCGADFDTKVAVYDGAECPSALSMACSDDDCGPGLGSRLSFPAQTGNPYLIRVGGFEGDTGTATLTIYCASDSNFGVATCGVSTGDCTEASDAPGCADTECCLDLCTIDPFCCDTQWDGTCVEKAGEIICRDTPPDACGAGAGDCNDPMGNGTPGCEDPSCCQAVCESDPFCCLTEWDDICAFSAEVECGTFQACEGATGDCDAEQTTPGCDAPSCCNAVCSVDPACCAATGTWDDLCVEAATTTPECQ